MEFFETASPQKWRFKPLSESTGHGFHPGSSELDVWKPKERLGGGLSGIVSMEKCISGPSQDTVRAVKRIEKSNKNFSDLAKSEVEALIEFSDKSKPEVSTTRGPRNWNFHSNPISNLFLQYKQYFVQFLGWFDDACSLSIAMELVEHGDLQKYIEPGCSFSEQQSASIVTQVAQALRFMHRKRIVHRDIKPLVSD